MKHWLLPLLCFLLPATVAVAQTSRKAPPPPDVFLRHALDPQTAAALSSLVVRFNDAEAKRRQRGGRIVLEDAQGLADKSRLPHMAFFNQDDMPLLFDAQPRFRPLHQVMAAARQPFNPRTFHPQASDPVEDSAGRIQALPLGLSLPVLFYNQAAFAQAGIDPQAPPKTWWQLQETAGALRDAGFGCPLTSARFTWVHVENVAAQQGEPHALRRGKTQQLALNNLVNVKHLALLTTWHRSLYFAYSGPGREGEARFASGECAMLTGESAFFKQLRHAQPDFPLGVAPLPHYDDVHGARPLHALPDGAALWVLAGGNPAQQALVARFITFLMRAENQREWVRTTGFLPMTPAAAQALGEAGAAPSLLALAQARLPMTARHTGRTKPAATRTRVRHIMAEEIELVWAGVKPPKLALDTAVQRTASVLAPPPPGRPGR